ncbi:aminotransferase class I/II-fold pyridoxal phosphate-dependent enzyme [Arthrobacter sp. AK01]|uniref:aminotransferase class I/II-fold pyridoxal phosphate-dependent enzyme n=1 Tax=Arthrobacter sp. AK01 TaxID=2894084 RepID=UPI001E41E7ED|nr:aminotransferase class I/II-fold pyridoxal phosphate-dependent enzyme [Arthrobacter sp. AK01]MCD4850310.1 aminotransferase class I/II-fold pyridoxal phosphate-dependent enzyme [Arthrobacter sp. AK01]
MPLISPSDAQDAAVASESISALQSTTPYADALRSLASHAWQRLHVPAHQGHVHNAPGVAALVGPEALALDFPMLFSGIDQHDWRLVSSGRETPLVQAQALAAEAWGASRTWFLTNGASGGNHIATTVVRALGKEFVVQRSVHSSVIDGITHVDLEPHFVQGAVDAGLGSAHGVTAEQVEEALRAHPGSAAVYVVSPSYFGAVADITGISAVAHRYEVPLIVDEAWGSHFGLHPALPVNAVRAGADLVISSTHKGAGSLTQSAMLHLGHGPYARKLESLVDRVVRSFQSTSCSALLLASLDEARRHLVMGGPEMIGKAVESAEAIRAAVRASTRFRDATPDILASPDAVAYDPLKIVIDTRGAGITGTDAQYRLIRDHRIYCELATPAALLLLVGATAPADVGRILTALHSLPQAESEPERMRALPPAGERRMGLQAAFFSAVETVPWQEAEGRISVDSLAAYPPGIPNVLPGEVLGSGSIAFLRGTAAAPSGYVRGAHDPALDYFRVVAR